MSRPIVLIHGAWHGGWCFDWVAEPLRARGHDVHTPDLPFTGQEDDFAAARHLIAEHPGAVVLGHSYGGAVITAACSGLDVSHMVYLCAFVGEPADDVTPAGTTAALTAAIKPHEGRLSVDPELGVDVFYQDCPAEAVARAQQNLRSMVMGRLPPVEGEPAWRSIPSTYVVCTEDNAIPPDDQRALARRCTNVVEWQVSHSPFFARPGLMVDLLAGLAD